MANVGLMNSYKKFSLINYIKYIMQIYFIRNLMNRIYFTYSTNIYFIYLLLECNPIFFLLIGMILQQSLKVLFLHKNIFDSYFQVKVVITAWHKIDLIKIITINKTSYQVFYNFILHFFFLGKLNSIYV